MTVSGNCNAKFAELKEEFQLNFEERGESGASVCLSVNGETLVDLWGGVANPETKQVWEKDTLSIVFSCTKSATALCAHILIDRAQLDPDALGKEYWPELGKHGKDRKTGAMMLNHESALPALKYPVKPGGFLDWHYMIQRMEDEIPFWVPGTRKGYHMVNFGWTLVAFVRRVSGHSLRQFFRDELPGPPVAASWIRVTESLDRTIVPTLPSARQDAGEQ